MEDEREKRIKMLQTQQHISSLYNPINKDIENLRAEYEKKLLDKNLLINELLKRVKELTNQISNFNTDKNLL